MLNLASQSRSNHSAALLGGELVLTEQAIAVLRHWLIDAGLGEWRIFQGPMQHLQAIDHVLDRLDADAVWESMESSLVGPESMVAVTFDADAKPATRAWPSGVLHLRKLQVAVCRWYWYDTQRNYTENLYLLAAPQVECIDALRSRLTELNRERPRPVWMILGGYDEITTPREPVAEDSLVFGAAVRQRVETDILGFYSPPIAAMYRKLGVPYRRGVLLYGEPGNGKTSLIRYIGARLPNVAGLLIRAGSEFGTDALAAAFDQWKQLAPAILVIEDLTAILERVNLSTLLNLLDGVDHKTSGGLMLIASTNYPEKLDPALSNRPGRFDVVMELPSPDKDQRRQFLASRLLELDSATIDKTIAATEQMSFAHLEEIVQLSGMIAIRADREFRLPTDVSEALDHVRRAFNTARSGYAKLPETPFGLAGLRSLKR